jgi:DNA-binding HxlR family transcriptional regulator
MISARHEIENPRFISALAKIARHPNAAVLCALGAGPHRMSDLLSTLGTISEIALGASLRELDNDGLVLRRVDSGPPLRVLYELTPLGTTLTASLRALREWGLRQA